MENKDYTPAERLRAINFIIRALRDEKGDSVEQWRDHLEHQFTDPEDCIPDEGHPKGYPPPQIQWDIMALDQDPFEEREAWRPPLARAMEKDASPGFITALQAILNENQDLFEHCTFKPDTAILGKADSDKSDVWVTMEAAAQRELAKKLLRQQKNRNRGE